MSLPILSPRSDFIFKLIFGDQRNTDILTAFLQSFLDLPESEYDTLTIVDPHLKREERDDKLGILDVKINTKSGNIIDVEIQIADDVPMQERILYYTSKMVTQQIGKGDDYSAIKRVITVVITNFILIHDSENYHNTYRLNDIKSGSQFTDLMEVNTLELPKLPSENDRTQLWDWLKFFRSNKEEELKMLETKSPQIKKAVGVLMELSADERTRLLYEEQEKIRMDQSARIAYAERKIRFAEEKVSLAEEKAFLAEEKVSLAEKKASLAEEKAFLARENGIREGETKGERKGKIETARKALSKNMSVEDVIDLTGLSRSEIESLQ
jgi:predicted transposase/invertase (TIGR01784 family)